ncbi:hypothetical protein Fcan01_27492 [Folsomia candida]|uniref:CCHC-type domain-containing protein n=1 Tax=Folsomia candida TaxID=158441 RepID=A0A226CZ01_FOLCA|nr:hypothetical protein Fcan01_27492 [Folsomia candida]
MSSLNEILEQLPEVVRIQILTYIEQNDVVNKVKLLQTRRQSDSDPSEQFIYEMYSSGKQIDPLECEEVNLKRIRDALHPDISALVGDLKEWSVGNLIEQVSGIHSLFSRQNRLKLVPPFKSKPQNSQTDDRNNNFDSSNSREFSHRSLQNSYGNRKYNQGNSNCVNSNSYDSQNQNNYKGDRNGLESRGMNRGQNSGYFNNPYNYLHRGKYSSLHNSNQIYHNSNQNQYRGNFSGNRSGNSSYNLYRIKCRKCLNYGHYARDCSSKPTGVVTALPEYPQQGVDSEQPAAQYPTQHST